MQNRATSVSSIFTKRAVWRYEKGWRPYDEDEKESLTGKRVEGYCREIKQVHSLRDLRDLQDRIALDDQLAEHDKLRLRNSTMETWKTLAYRATFKGTVKGIH